MGVSAPTIRRYLDLLSGLYLVRQLHPWHENLGKRQVKSPKVYLRDSGLLHALLGIQGPRDLLSHPKVGASWEGYAMEEVLKVVQPEAAYFWATHTGAELDLLLLKRGRRWGVEFKFSDAPRLTPSMRTALKDLGLDGLTVIYPGDRGYSLGDRVAVMPLARLAEGDPQVVVRPARRARARVAQG